MTIPIRLQEIIDYLWIHPEHSEWTPKTDIIPLEAFREWMNCGDIEILGLVYSLISDERFRIEPALTLDETTTFLKDYFGRCFRENPRGKWADSRYSAGWDLVNVLTCFWKDPLVPRAVLSEWKKWIGDLYKEGPDEVRVCLVQATLEHLFEQKDLREYFSDWTSDPILKTAYEEASQWHKGGGRSSLGKPPFVG